MVTKIKRFLKILRLEVELFVILIIGLIFVLIDKLKQRQNKFCSPDKIKNLPSNNILFIQIYGIGNFILSSTMQVAIRKHFSNGKIFAIVHPAIKELAQKCPYIDEVIVYEDRSISGKIKLINQLHQTDFRLAIDLSGTYWTAWLSRLSRAPKRVGFNAVSVNRLWFNLDGSGGLYTLNLPFHQDVHMKEFYDRMLEILDVSLEDRSLKIFPSNQDNEFARQVFSKWQTNISIIAIHIGARQKERLWAVEGFAELIHQLLFKKNVRIILLGATGDIERGNEILSLLHKEQISSVVSLVGKTTLYQLAAIISKSNLFIGHDSGPMHIACAVETKGVALFGPGVVELWGPWSKEFVVIQSQVPCRGCNKIGHFYKCSKNICMSEISVTQVLNEVEKLLNKTIDHRPWTIDLKDT